ncbi:unnamed protein product [Adineta ricciae]|uniref:TLDc domain-containing protein n=1 Tax=Adineta ricciae TaxID=249248 RepID=A0A813Z331_ADIRI|nr:unnamed protein product [Adineta ricciae]CAF1166653.1 unnamed protein product [Adineta ricciae]
MGNTASHSTTTNSKKSDNKSQHKDQIYEQIIGSLSKICTDDQFPLNIFRQKADISTHHRIIEIVLSPRLSDEFSSLIVQLYWNNRSTISRDDVTKLIRDCCVFDLKQVLSEHGSTVESNMIENNCFMALTNSIGTVENTQIEQEEFYRWIRVQFPTLFYCLELWLRKNATLAETTKESASNRTLMKMDNILNPTWVWLLAHQLPIVYLSADNTCTNLFDRMSSLLHGRMWDHLYNSHRDGASLNRFQHHIFGYKAALVMLFEISDGYLFCLCCDEEFRESPKYFGGIQTCLLQLKPVFKLILEGSHIIFMNTKLRSISTLGLCVGRDHGHTFLSIDEDFFNVKHINGEGRLVAIDVWGTGGKKSSEEQNDMRQWEERQVEKSRKVKRSYEEEEAVLNMAGIETRHAQDQF